LDLVPFFIGQIRWVTYRMRLHPIHLWHAPNVVQHKQLTYD
jgi:hypothetical protein